MGLTLPTCIAKVIRQSTQDLPGPFVVLHKELPGELSSDPTDTIACVCELGVAAGGRAGATPH